MRNYESRAATFEPVVMAAIGGELLCRKCRPETHVTKFIQLHHLLTHERIAPMIRRPASQPVNDTAI